MQVEGIAINAQGVEGDEALLYIGLGNAHDINIDCDLPELCLLRIYEMENC